MIEVLQFVFSSFWVFLGTFMLLGVVTQGTVAILAIVFGRRS